MGVIDYKSGKSQGILIRELGMNPDVSSIALRHGTLLLHREILSS